MCSINAQLQQLRSDDTLQCHEVRFATMASIESTLIALVVGRTNPSADSSSVRGMSVFTKR